MGNFLLGCAVWQAKPAARAFYTVGFSLAKRKGLAEVYLPRRRQGFADHGKIGANGSKSSGFVPAGGVVLC
ncbi:MAG: hypothetical protein CFE33_20030 [Pseudorhodobacter sp. PARRP1]|nr:MAG: hypothetical protein CFE33_20030 [Pseudorhodobacter sp. PARRP1]